MPQAKRRVRKRQVWRRRGTAVQLVYHFHLLSISHYSCVFIGGRKHLMIETTGMLNTRLIAILAIWHFISFKSRGVLRLLGFHIRMSLVRMLKPVLLHAMWERPSFLFMQMIHIPYTVLPTDIRMQIPNTPCLLE
jgi:hypothetical protein